MVETFLQQLRRVNMDRYLAWVGDGEDAGILFDAAELGGEVGELLNVVKKLVREHHGWRGSRATAQDFADECADVLICLDKLARRRSVDLEAATVAKFNATSEKQGFPHRLFHAPQEHRAGDEKTVEFVRYWLMSGDHSVSAWEREFAAAIDARLAALTDTQPPSPTVRQEPEDGRVPAEPGASHVVTGAGEAVSALPGDSPSREADAELLMDVAGTLSRAGDRESAQEVRDVASRIRRDDQVVDAISRAIVFGAYLRADPLAICLQFQSDADRLAAAEALDEVMK